MSSTTPRMKKPKKVCDICKSGKPVIKRPKTGQMVCKECFYFVFEEEIHQTIIQGNVFKENERVAIGASGGKGIHIYIYIKEIYMYNIFSINFKIILFLLNFIK